MKRLGPRHFDYIRHRAGGKSAAEAARLAGFKPRYAKSALTKLDGHPLIAAEIDKMKTALVAQTGYDQKMAMAEFGAALEFAKQTDNATAFVRAVELRSKLHGLLIEKIDQRNVGSFQINISGIDDTTPLVDVTPEADDREALRKAVFDE